MKAYSLLGCALALAMIGCGGGGVSENASTDWARAYTSAIAAQNITTVGSLISNSYLNSCETKAQRVNFFQDMFDSATTVNVSFDVNSSFVNDAAGLGQVTGDLQIVATGPGYNFTSSQFVVFPLIREAGVWRLYGNQSCP